MKNCLILVISLLIITTSCEFDSKSISIDSPVEGYETSSDSVVIYGSLSGDTDSDAEYEVRYYVNYLYVGSYTSTDSLYSFSFETSLTNGDNRIEVIAYEDGEEFDSDSIVIFRDSIAPILSITYPPALTTIIVDSITFVGNAYDNDVLETLVCWTSRNSDRITLEQPVWSVEFDNLTNGDLTFYVRATDLLGNYSQQNHVIEIDAVP